LSLQCCILFPRGEDEAVSDESAGGARAGGAEGNSPVFHKKKAPRVCLAGSETTGHARHKETTLHTSQADMFDTTAEEQLRSMPYQLLESAAESSGPDDRQEEPNLSDSDGLSWVGLAPSGVVAANPPSPREDSPFHHSVSDGFTSDDMVTSTPVQAKVPNKVEYYTSSKTSREKEVSLMENVENLTEEMEVENENVKIQMKKCPKMMYKAPSSESEDSSEDEQSTKEEKILIKKAEINPNLVSESFAKGKMPKTPFNMQLLKVKTDNNILVAELSDSKNRITMQISNQYSYMFQHVKKHSIMTVNQLKKHKQSPLITNFAVYKGLQVKQMIGHPTKLVAPCRQQEP
jgi:hypothetical protein